MSAPIVVVQWLHVILGLFWFGSNLYVDAILIPTLNNLPLKEQQKIGALIGPRTSQVLVPVGLAVVALGILRGTVFGRLHSLDAVFGTTYGVTWLIALLLSIGIIFWGLLALKPRAEALNTAPTPEAYGAVINQLKVLTLVEIAGFVAVFTCMILMRFE
ncbi:MAG TPA: hypothetical protein VFW17_00565 [Ktedonobacterales bacterium]|nr:hypothetical protein [Ktedonobacterales bacterium]